MIVLGVGVAVATGAEAGAGVVAPPVDGGVEGLASGLDVVTLAAVAVATVCLTTFFGVFFFLGSGAGSNGSFCAPSVRRRLVVVASPSDGSAAETNVVAMPSSWLVAGGATAAIEVSSGCLVSSTGTATSAPTSSSATG